MSRTTQSAAAYDDAADDIVWGIDGEHGIAAVLGLRPPQVYYLIRRGKLPVRRHGHKTYSASRRRLLEYCAGELPNTAA